MGQLQSSAPFFRAGPPATVGNPDKETLRYLEQRAEGSILDMGGGMGAYSFALKSAGHDVTLAEMDPVCLANARKFGIATLDVGETPWESLKGRFDTVILVDVLEHVAEHRDFLKNVVSCARKKVLLTVPCNDDFEKLFELCITYNHIAVTDHIHQFTSKDVSLLLDELGCKYTILPGSHLFPDPILILLHNEMWKTIRGKFALTPLKILRKLGWLPRLFPSRIFVEAIPPGMR